ncbi:hypothetical protein DAPPUDRAFT_327978 [Daphnia pulex]|uniref:Uncharacterized protein n=1 Tax=Daphnia pulex TaxID=6669 RepID=E9HCC4_DAPPU|nr:hypothetical protein DAPPUDRAFT_327978 [Daphnia pulex]|eukprot:EFX70635.1 hypothetical protein DAPPUDRAFT_327978 [Daphnia pulex]
MNFIRIVMFFAVCLSMIAVIVANPTPADNEGGVASARDQRQRKLCLDSQCSHIRWTR